MCNGNFEFIYFKSIKLYKWYVVVMLMVRNINELKHNQSVPSSITRTSNEDLPTFSQFHSGQISQKSESETNKIEQNIFSFLDCCLASIMVILFTDTLSTVFQIGSLTELDLLFPDPHILLIAY
eukprot:499195_1